MKKTGLILFYLLLACKLYSQDTGEILKVYCQNFDYSELLEGLNDFSRKNEIRTKYSWNTQLEREIVNGYSEQIIKFVKEVQDENNEAIHTVFTHKIYLLKKENIISFYKVIRDDNIKKKAEWVLTEILVHENTNQQSLNELKYLYSQVYSIDLNFQDLFNTEIVYGEGCGRFGTHPKYRLILNKIIEKKETTEIINWLRSPTVEVQLYAIEGIYKLKRKGVKFDSTSLDLINIIEKKQGSAYTCSGCMYWHQPINKIVKRIKKEQK